MGNRYGLEIRAATAADAPGLAELLGSTGLSVAAQDVVERLDALRAGQGTVLIALEWGPPSGVIVLHWYRTLATAAPVAEITLLHVGAEERRRGVGRVLLKAAARAARQAGCETLRLCAAEDQTALRAFCAANGFLEDTRCLMRSLRKQGRE
ncbi:GNAT family N-acetyltransferase [Methylobacterium trifolii]